MTKVEAMVIHAHVSTNNVDVFLYYGKTRRGFTLDRSQAENLYHRLGYQLERLRRHEQAMASAEQIISGAV